MEYESIGYNSIVIRLGLNLFQLNKGDFVG